MNLNEITADIRLRNPWEAIDLGFAMVQKWWKELYLPLAIITTCIASILYFFTPYNNLWIASLIFWWLKPFYDRIVLHIISRKLFNQTLSTWQVFTEIPSLLWNTGFFQSLTFRRLSLSRGFNLAIWQLEQLRGPKRAQRQKVLHQMSHTQAVWLTIGLVLLEVIMWVSLFGLLYLFLPENTAKTFFTSLFNDNIKTVEWIGMVDYVFYILVVTFIHPFYIAASFSLYINRRTQLEAWDLELDFRKLAMRLKTLNTKVIPVILLVSLYSTSILLPSTTYAENIKIKPENQITEILADERLAASKSKEVIQETMKIKELNDRKIVKYWVPKDIPKNNKQDDSFAELFEPFAKFMGFIIEFGLWFLLAIGLFLLFVFRDSWLGLFNRNKKIKADSYQAPEVMFGMDVRPDSIPEDVISAVKKLLDSKQTREAFSLLYRAALIKLINQDKIQLLNSHTENDVLRVSIKKISKTKQEYLSLLTNAWKEVAYAHRNPDDNDIHHLLTSWKTEFAVAPVTNKVEENPNE